MLTKSDITVTQRRVESYGVTEVVAYVTLKTVLRVSDILPRVVIEQAKEEAVQALWHRVYGKLTDPLRGLQHHAQLNCNGVDALRVRQLCDELNALLGPPK